MTQKTLLAGRLPVEPFTMAPPVDVMTVDVEDWYHVNYASAPARPVDPVARVEENTRRVLDLLDQSASHATFFVLGEVARSHPRLVTEIAARGHEIACHGLDHDLVYRQTPVTFRAAVSTAREALEQLSARRVIGFRAPSWSITRDSLWALDVLAEAGFTYDSSIFPVANYLYGIAGAPCRPYWIPTTAGRLLEVPPPVWQLGPLRVPHGGGFYLRLLPLWLERLALARAQHTGQPALVYLHPRELDPDPPRLRLSKKEAFIQDFGHPRARRKLSRLIVGRRWVSLQDGFSSVLPAQTA